ncbi:MAG: NYN domain-containing protein [Eubacteriales bacterium]|nr:NYN domain-containing protein [Eubacteriales bacterium]
MEDLNIALLIDSDNISARYIAGILRELSKYGKITIRRMYGDWSQDRLHSWMRCASRYSLTPIMQPNNTPGKNASDIGLIIDAMDILYTGDVQGFCIVSSDGDFNKLATRLREAGKFVIGMGEKKTPESFRVSCERFIFLNIVDDEGENEEETVTRTKTRSGSGRRKAGSPASSPAGTAVAVGASLTGGPGSGAVSPSSGSGPAQSGTAAGRRRKTAALAEAAAVYNAPDDDDTDFYSDGEGESDITDKATIENAIVKIITDNNAEGKETGLGEIGSRIVKIFPDFDVRNYDYSKLSEFLKDFPSLKVENRDSAVWVSLNSSSDSEIEQQIQRIFASHNTRDMYLTTLRKELEAVNPNLEASIRRSGVTRFSVYLNRMIPSVEVNGRYVLLKSR